MARYTSSRAVPPSCLSSGDHTAAANRQLGWQEQFPEEDRAKRDGASGIPHAWGHPQVQAPRCTDGHFARVHEAFHPARHPRCLTTTHVTYTQERKNASPSACAKIPVQCCVARELRPALQNNAPNYKLGTAAG